MRTISPRRAADAGRKAVPTADERALGPAELDKVIAAAVRMAAWPPPPGRN
jgi:hypothetical protein